MIYDFWYRHGESQRYRHDEVGGQPVRLSLRRKNPVDHILHPEIFINSEMLEDGIDADNCGRSEKSKYQNTRNTPRTRKIRESEIQRTRSSGFLIIRISDLLAFWVFWVFWNVCHKRVIQQGIAHRRPQSSIKSSVPPPPRYRRIYTIYSTHHLGD